MHSAPSYFLFTHFQQLSPQLPEALDNFSRSAYSKNRFTLTFSAGKIPWFTIVALTLTMSVSYTALAVALAVALGVAFSSGGMTVNVMFSSETTKSAPRTVTGLVQVLFVSLLSITFSGVGSTSTPTARSPILACQNATNKSPFDLSCARLIVGTVLINSKLLSVVFLNANTLKASAGRIPTLLTSAIIFTHSPCRIVSFSPISELFSLISRASETVRSGPCTTNILVLLLLFSFISVIFPSGSAVTVIQYCPAYSVSFQLIFTSEELLTFKKAIVLLNVFLYSLDDSSSSISNSTVTLLAFSSPLFSTLAVIFTTTPGIIGSSKFLSMRSKLRFATVRSAARA